MVLPRALISMYDGSNRVSHHGSGARFSVLDDFTLAGASRRWSVSNTSVQHTTVLHSSLHLAGRCVTQSSSAAPSQPHARSFRCSSLAGFSHAQPSVRTNISGKPTSITGPALLDILKRFKDMQNGSDVRGVAMDGEHICACWPT